VRLKEGKAPCVFKRRSPSQAWGGVGEKKKKEKETKARKIRRGIRGEPWGDRQVSKNKERLTRQEQRVQSHESISKVLSGGKGR